MKQIVTYAIAVLLAVVSFTESSAQNNDLHRTRLIPYPTAAEATKHSLAKQRFMQPVMLESTAEDTFSGEFTFPFSWLERQVVVRVEGVGAPYELFVNGKCAGGATNGHAATEFNITKLSREDKNRVELRLADSKSVAAIECFEKETCPALYVISQPRVRVRDIFYRTDIANTGIVNVNFGVVMQNLTLGAKSSRLEYELYLNDTTRLSGGRLDVELGMYGVDTMRFGAPAPDSVLWSAQSPQRISLRLVNRIAGREAEVYDIPVALRELSFDKEGIIVNGERLSSGGIVCRHYQTSSKWSRPIMRVSARFVSRQACPRRSYWSGAMLMAYMSPSQHPLTRQRRAFRAVRVATLRTTPSGARSIPSVWCR